MSLLKVGVSGHRKLLADKQTIKKAVKLNLLTLSPNFEELEILTGMALGFDQLVCECCLELNQELGINKFQYIAVTPCDDQDKLWTPEQQKTYNFLLSKAKVVVNVSPGPYQVWKMFARNKWIVDGASTMIVHWNKDFSGGTGHAMKLVIAAKKPYILI